MAKLICQYLFQGIGAPLHIFSQEFCEVMKCKGPGGVTSNLKVKGTRKDLFLKPLEKLFQLLASKFSIKNTIIVDNSLEKHVFNEPANVVLPHPWSEGVKGKGDRFLVDELLPWIRRLHLCRSDGFRSFRWNDNISRQMLSEKSVSHEYVELMTAIEASKSKVDERCISRNR